MIVWRHKWRAYIWLYQRENLSEISIFQNMPFKESLSSYFMACVYNEGLNFSWGKKKENKWSFLTLFIIHIVVIISCFLWFVHIFFLLNSQRSALTAHCCNCWCFCSFLAWNVFLVAFMATFRSHCCYFDVWNLASLWPVSNGLTLAIRWLRQH